MAAPVFQSVQSSDTSITGNGTRVVTKPTGLAVGDLMISFSTNASGTGTTHPTGFTTLGIEDNAAGGIRTQLAYKVADSSDVAASNFSFTTCGYASISRITGASGAAIVYIDGQQTNSSSFSAGGLTPVDRGDGILLMMYLTFESGSSGTVGSYAIATSNPTWTERDNYPGASANGTGMATATRPEVTATGNFSGSGAGGLGSDWTGHLIAVHIAYAPVTVSETVTLTEGYTNGITKIISDTVNLIETFLNIFNRFTNQSKNSSSYTNQAKNSTTFTNQSKNSSTWANEDKN